MSAFKAVVAVIFASVLVACTPGSKTVYEFPDGKVPLNTYTVTKLNVVVPETLVVSEANEYYPNADIVWRFDPPGNRYEQVKAIFEMGMGRGVQALSGRESVAVAVEVVRFHSVTERTRYVLAGNHSITFNLSVTDSATGQAIAPPREVRADLDAYGGDDAIKADFRGENPKKRITDHLAGVIQRELAVIYLETNAQ